MLCYVHKRATILAVIGDQGRTPYFIDVVCSILKFLKELKHYIKHEKHVKNYTKIVNILEPSHEKTNNLLRRKTQLISVFVFATQIV